MALIIKNLSKSFGNKTVFDTFSYEFQDRGLYLLKGNSGVGKTTLLRMIAGLDGSYDGEIIGGGIKNTSVAFQEYRLFPMLSALDNAVIPNAEGNECDVLFRAKELLRALGFSEHDMQLKPKELSGGMKQRVSLTRAFLRKAPVLLLDEPTKELDGVLQGKVIDIIRKEAESRLVIVVTHDPIDLEGAVTSEIIL